MTKRASDQDQTVFRLSPVAAGAAVLVMAMGAAHGQTAPSTQPAAPQTQAEKERAEKEKAEREKAAAQTITVTGIRRGIENSINVKKNADSIVEAISAEDIAKLPDPTVAESISRLPGVATQRNKSTSRAQQISVRGLAPDFTTGTLNGREQASNGDSRGVEFDQFPAELMGSVVIHKSPHAGLVNQGIGATADMRLVRPLDFNRRSASVNFREQKSGIGSDFGEGSGNRISLAYIDQFADRKLGVALGFARFKDDGAAQAKFNAWGGWTPEVDYDHDNNPATAPIRVQAPGGFTADSEKTAAKRDGLAAVLQFKPNKDFTSTLDVLHSEGNFKISKKGLEGAIGGQSAGGYDPAGQLINATIASVNGANVATAGTITNYKGVVRNHDESADDTLNSLGWNNRFTVGSWTLDADLSASKVERNNSRYETTAGQPGNHSNGNGTLGPLGTISWTGFNGSNHDQVRYTTSLNYSDPAVARLTDVMGWSGGETSPQAGYVALPITIDKISAVRLGAKSPFNLGPVSELEFGVNLAKRDKLHTANEGRLVIRGSADPYASVAVPSPGVAIAGTTGLPVIAWNPTGSLGTIYDLPAKVDRDILNKDWDVSEKVNTAFVKSSIETNLLGRTVTGNIGVQLVNTKQSGAGFYIENATCTGNTPATCPSTRVQLDDSFNDVLPSANLAMDLGGDQVLRLGVARVMSRPNMADMRGSVRFGLNATAPGGPRIEGDGGNPQLKPFRANALDLSYEKYFGTKAYFAVAGFYKDLATYVYRQQTAIDFSRYGVTLPAGWNPVGLFTQPANGTGGKLQGIELTASVPFGLFVKPLDGFGIEVNHADTSSNIKLPANALNVNDVGGTEVSLPGLSRKVTNFKVYFEKAGFQASIGRRERSRFLGEITDFQDNRQLTYVDGESTVDLQVGYEIQSGPLKGLSVLFQGNNLTKTEFRRVKEVEVRQDPTNPASPVVGKRYDVVERVQPGKTYLLGISYKL